MALSLTIIMLFMLFGVSFLVSYRQRFSLNPVQTERFALGVAASTTGFALALISVICIFVTSIWWGVVHLLSLLALCVALARSMSAKHPGFWIVVLCFTASVVLSVPYAIIPVYRMAP